MQNQYIYVAHKYLDLGLAVVPIKNRSKLIDYEALTPIPQSKLKLLLQIFSEIFSELLFPYIKGMASEQEIHQWFDGTNERNIGLSVGYKNLLLLDCDSQELFDLWAKKYPDIVKNTAVQKTHAGYHVFFICPQKFYSSIAVFEGQVFGDTKSYKGWVIVWPSIHPSGYQYKWLKGQAPWETSIYKIDTLEEIGIKRIPRKSYRLNSLISRTIHRLKLLLNMNPTQSVLGNLKHIIFR